MPILPLAVAFAAIALDRTAAGAACSPWSWPSSRCPAFFALALWLDPHAANDSAVLFARSRFADGLRLRPRPLHPHAGPRAPPGFSCGSRPGSCCSWASSSGCAGLPRPRAEAVRDAVGREPRSGHRGAGDRPLRAIVMLLGLVLAAAALLERWPSRRDEAGLRLLRDPGRRPRPSSWTDRSDGRTTFSSSPGPTTLVVRSPGRRGAWRSWRVGRASRAPGGRPSPCGPRASC